MQFAGNRETKNQIAKKKGDGGAKESLWCGQESKSGTRRRAMTPDIPERLKRFEIPGRVTLLEGNGELPKVELTSDWSTAEVYLLGAHVSDFRKRGEAPLLFTSQCSRFAAGQPIRGGVPIIFPWFGAKESSPAHGFARTVEWDLHEATTVPEGGVSLRFGFPGCGESAMWPPFAANYVVTLTEVLTLELIVTNSSAGHPLGIETCLHTYFSVADIGAVRVAGLRGLSYLDKVEQFAPKTEDSDAIAIQAEVDRIYLDAPGPVEILDPSLHRRIRIAKSGSNSTVLWNPWVARSQQMADFGNDEYKQMLCVESGNVANNKLQLEPGKSSVLKVELSSSPL
jgi:D-hexose-6-phosphate mutarotase